MPVAAADPAVPAEPIVAASASPAAVPGAAPAAEAPVPGAPLAVAAAPADASNSITPPNGMSHLPSPDSPPPGTTTVAGTDQQHPSLGYIKDMWNAVKEKEVSPSDALVMLLAQRPSDPSKLASSVPQQAPLSAPAPADAPAAAPAPAPAAPILVPAPAEAAPAG